jgi:hypothetical protein
MCRRRRQCRRRRVSRDRAGAILYREYLRNDLTAPAFGPIEFELRDVQVVGASLTGTAMVRNLQKRRFPRISKITITSSSQTCCLTGVTVASQSGRSCFQASL